MGICISQYDRIEYSKMNKKDANALEADTFFLNETNSWNSSQNQTFHLSFNQQSALFLNDTLQIHPRIDIIRRGSLAKGAMFTLLDEDETSCPAFKKKDIEVGLKRLNSPYHELQLQNADCNSSKENFLNQFIFTGFNSLSLDASHNKQA